jgi:hypothetical protein
MDVGEERTTCFQNKYKYWISKHVYHKTNTLRTYFDDILYRGNSSYKEACRSAAEMVGITSSIEDAS